MSQSGRANLDLPTLYNPRGLRRYVGALGDALFGVAPIVAAGDSLVYGQGADGVNGTGNNVTDAAQGWPGQLRKLFAATYGDPGEGYIFPSDSRVGNGTGASAGNFRFQGPLRHAVRLISGQALATLTVPTGVTVVSVVQANASGDVTGLYSKNGGADTGLTALTGTGVSIVTDISVTAGDTIVVKGPASAQTYIAGLLLKTSATVGVPVHRVGIQGYVSGDALGGQTTGVLAVTATADQNTAAKKLYDWVPGGPGLLIVGFGVNDQQNQATSGAANGVTLSLYTTWTQQIVTQAVADGWAVLLLAPPANPNAANVAGGQEADYHGALQGIALATDHCAFLDVSEVWGTAANGQALGLQFAASVHATRKGYGGIARIVHRAITRQVPT